MLRLVSLAVCLPFFVSSAFAAPAPEPLRLASAAARVGDGEAALKHLEGVKFSGDAGLAARVVRARALLRLNRPAEARAAVDGLDEEALAEPVGLIRLRAAEAEGDAAAIIAAADVLLKLRDADRATVAEARLRRALAIMSTDPAAGRPLLQALADDPPVKAIVPMALGALGAAGDAEADRRLLLSHGDTAEGRAAMTRTPSASLSPEDRLTRARDLWIQRAYALAEPEWQAMADNPKSDAAMRQEAWLRLGTIRQRLRERYPQALELFEKVKTGPDSALADEAQYRVGLVLGNLARYRAASQAMQAYLDRAPKGKYARSAGYQVGRLLHQGGHFDDALAAHERFLATKPWDRSKYVWFFGWTHFRKGDCPAARATWKSLIGSGNVLVGAKALYWTARCHRIEGDPAAADKALDTLARRAPLSYYGMLGARLAGKELPRIIEPAQVPAAPDLQAYEKKLGKRDRRALRSARLLSWAGHPRLARQAFDRKKMQRAVRRAYGKRKARAFDRALDEALEDWGERWRGLPKKQRRIPWNDRFADRPASQRTAAYPAAYLTLATAAGAPHGIPPWWLLPHMLQESRYREKARSHAGALGPMQVLPRTGRIIASKLGFPAGDFIEDRLFEPGVALRHAAWYLEALRDEYRGDIVLAIGAYNGGPLRFGEHLLGDAAKLPYDAMIEEIGAHESRNYARKVTDHLVRYLALYASDAERDAWMKALVPPADPPKPKGAVRF